MAKVPTLQFPGIYADRKFVSPHVRVELTIYPLPTRAETGFRKKRSLNARYLDWRSNTEASIIGMTWNKQLGQPSGQWTAQVKLRRDAGGVAMLDLDEFAIADGDWADLSVVRNGVSIPLCRGVLDSVRKQTQAAKGATTVVYTLTGRDHGAFFEKPITWSSIWAQTLSEVVGGLMTRRLKHRVGGRPDELFKAIIEAAFIPGDAGSPSGQWTLPQSLGDKVGYANQRLIDILKIVRFNAEKGTEGLRGAYYNEPGLWTIGEQGLHETLSQWTNPLLNEFWYDLLPPGAFLPEHGLASFLGVKDDVPSGEFPPRISDAYTLGDDTAPQEFRAKDSEFGTIAAIIRERPFPNTYAGSESMWYSLPTWVIPTWILESTDLGRSGDQRYNLFEILSDFGIGSGPEQAAQSKPLWYKSDIATHGLCPYSQSTKFFADAANSGLGKWFDERSRWIRLLADWHGPNPDLYQGSITARIPLPEIRIGHRVILTNGNPLENIQLYVEGVNTTVRNASPTSGIRGSSSLILTRGFVGTDDDLIDATQKLSDLYTEAF